MTLQESDDPGEDLHELEVGKGSKGEGGESSCHAQMLQASDEK
jgi:hypothetical protein